MPIDWFPLWLSLRVAGFATVISLAISLPVAYLLASREWRGRDLLDAVTTLPLVLPPTVLGYYLLVAIGRDSAFGRLYEWLFGSPLIFTWQAATLAALVHSTPRVNLINRGVEWTSAARVAACHVKTRGDPNAHSYRRPNAESRPITTSR